MDNAANADNSESANNSDNADNLSNTNNFYLMDLFFDKAFPYPVMVVSQFFLYESVLLQM